MGFGSLTRRAFGAVQMGLIGLIRVVCSLWLGGLVFLVRVRWQPEDGGAKVPDCSVQLEWDDRRSSAVLDARVRRRALCWPMHTSGERYEGSAHACPCKRPEHGTKK